MRSLQTTFSLFFFCKLHAVITLEYEVDSTLRTGQEVFSGGELYRLDCGGPAPYQDRADNPDTTNSHCNFSSQFQQESASSFV